MSRSSVGNPQTYEAGDMRDSKSTSKTNHDMSYREGKKNSHLDNDSKDQRSIANRMASAEKKGKEHNDDHNDDHKSKDPRDAALKHGNQPSKGAKIDAELQAEDELRLQEKGMKGKDGMPGKKN
ncbi:hypothetical protein FPQ18DRAFT_376225 [Pyronema domesticum]|uniref:Uncharacterized protein n=1 Tax=Pyronema omphalodes (strain CBS 100304) TaxID=1076935 RepID=U4LN58_PYROM|nr:hypothetical protein FPQ18DRAFT_376225 [Pyronema domesticum]CCX33358.1 Similar to hypothetical protein CHGG_06280 [Chaetomium globosum CBS 148.51]; acc. no. XP_001222375 [Pyronema omphalodes CBS 100304]